MSEVHDNPVANRYELEVDGQIAVVTYNLTGSNLMITETLVPEALEGRGIASRLARHVAEDARARGLTLLPVCPFFSAWLQKHNDQADIVHPTYRQILGLPEPAASPS